MSEHRRYPAITVWQPWASLIAAGAKPFEFRSWAAPRAYWETRIAIHSGRRPVKRAELQELIAKLEGHRWRETGLVREAALPILERAWNAPKALPVSAIVCLAVLGEPVRDDALAAQIGVELVRDSDRGEHSNWGWPLNAIEPFDPPPPARGAQGFWMWDAE